MLVHKERICIRALPATVLSILIALSGCQSASDLARTPVGVEMPETWSVPDDSAGMVDEDWWFSFSDPNLAGCVQEALAHNHDLRAAVARFDVAAARVRLAGAELSPQVDASLGAARQRQNFIGFPFGGDGSGTQPDGPSHSITTTYVLSANVRWEIDLWGRLRAAREASFAEFQASQAQMQAVHLSIAAQTAKAWFALVEARRQVQLMEETVATYKDTQRQVQDRVEAGVGSPVDLRLAGTNLDSAAALLEQRKILYDQQARQLEILLGRYPDGSIHSQATLPALSSPVPAGLPSELLLRRLDIVAAEKQLAAQRLRIEQARATLYPQITLTAAGGTRSEEFHNLLSSDFAVWSVSGGVLQPLFDGGTRLANIDIAKGQARVALAAYSNIVLRAFYEVETALVAESRLAARENRLRAATEQAKEAGALSEDRYEQGIEDFLTVLEAQRLALSSESELIAVERQRLDNRIDLHLALGGSFATDIKPRKTDLTLDVLLNRQDIVDEPSDEP